MVLDKLPGWNARDASSRWAARAAWTFAAAALAVAIAAFFVHATPLAQNVQPQQEGFPANDTFHDDRADAPQGGVQPLPGGSPTFDEPDTGSGLQTGARP